MARYRNPADLVGIDRTPALVRLMRACGAEEACITGKASDYDIFAAMAAALPLCTGHPEAARVQQLLTHATGLTSPLCPHTAPAYWRAWVDQHWYGREETLPTLPAPCPLCANSTPTVWRDGVALPDPMTIPAANLGAWSRELETALGQAGLHPLVMLPDDYTFVRPDPYHASLAVGKLSEGEPLTAEERDLILTQALRVWGLALARGHHDPQKALALVGGDPAAVTRLLAYLDSAKALPAMVWIPRDPTHVEAVSGLYATVKTGYTVCMTESPEVAEEKRLVYAAVAPIGAAVILLN